MTAYDVFANNIPATIAVMLIALYFLAKAIMYVLAPKRNAAMASVNATGNGGVSEIRTYFGGIPLAISALLVFLFARGLAWYGLVSGLILMNVMFFTRLFSAIAERGLSDRNIKRELIIEGLMVAVLWTLFVLSLVLY
jgi:hypothetical protein